MPDLVLSMGKSEAVQHSIGLGVMKAGESQRRQNALQVHQTEAPYGAV